MLDCLKRWQSDQMYHHRHKLNKLATKIKSGMGSPDWNVSMVNIHLRKLLWVYFTGHAVVKVSKDKLAGKATLISTLLLGRCEVLGNLRHYLRVQSRGHNTIDRLEERGVERGSDDGLEALKEEGRERAIVNQTNIGTVSKATLGKFLRDGVERIDTTLN